MSEPEPVLQRTEILYRRPHADVIAGWQGRIDFDGCGGAGRVQVGRNRKDDVIRRDPAVLQFDGDVAGTNPDFAHWRRKVDFTARVHGRSGKPRRQRLVSFRASRVFRLVEVIIVSAMKRGAGHHGEIGQQALIAGRSASVVRKLLLHRLLDTRIGAMPGDPLRHGRAVQILSSLREPGMIGILDHLRLFAQGVNRRGHILVNLVRILFVELLSVEEKRRLQTKAIEIRVGRHGGQTKSEFFRQRQPLRVSVADEFAAGLDDPAALLLLHTLPPTRSRASKTVTSQTFRRAYAAIRPANPAPTITMRGRPARLRATRARCVSYLSEKCACSPLILLCMRRPRSRFESLSPNRLCN